MDPAGIREFRGLLRSLADAGTTVFLSSHLLAEVEQVCDRVAVLNRGRVVEEGKVSELTAGRPRVRVVLEEADQPRARTLLAAWPTRTDGPDALLVESAAGRDVSAALGRGEVWPNEIRVEHTDLEEAFLHLTHDRTRATRPRTLRADGRYAMRLLRAELRKLNRPLTWGVAIASATFCVLLAVGGAHNAQQDAKTSPDAGRLPSCAVMGLPAGPACEHAHSEQRARAAQAQAARASTVVHVAAQLNPVATGAEAAGLMASLPGALMLALLSGGHVGGEWSGRTLKNLLTQHGRRREVLGAKFLSLWLAGVGLIAVCSGALALAGPIIAHVDHLPTPHQSVIDAAKWAGSQAGRALLVVAAFAVIGLLAAVLTRNTIGTIAGTAGAFVTMLVIAELPHLGRWTPATWVQGWMGFPVGQQSIIALPTNFWSRFITVSGSPPSHLLGFVGLAMLLVAAAIAALHIFERSDIVG